MQGKFQKKIPCFAEGTQTVAGPLAPAGRSQESNMLIRLCSERPLGWAGGLLVIRERFWRCSRTTGRHDDPGLRRTDGHGDDPGRCGGIRGAWLDDGATGSKIRCSVIGAGRRLQDRRRKESCRWGMLSDVARRASKHSPPSKNVHDGKTTSRERSSGARETHRRAQHQLEL